MRYEKIRTLSEEQFRRLTGVQKNTFNKMLEILTEEKRANRKYRGGRNLKLSMGDTLLMALEYLREYRTYFHIGQSYGISESSAFKSIRFVEDTLIKHKDFALPGRKALLDGIVEDVALIDVTESPIERPKKKSKALLFRKEKTTHHQEPTYCE